MALLLGAQPGRHFRTAPQSWPRTFVRRRSPGRALSYGAAVLAAHLGGGGRKAGGALVSAAKNRRAAGRRWLSRA